MENLVYAYLLLLFGILPIYMQDGLTQIGNVKYLFFRNTTVIMGVIFLAVLLVSLVSRRKEKRQISVKALFFSCTTDIFVWVYLLSAVASYLLSSYRQEALWGYYGWYMGLFSQVLFVGIYFACARYFDGSISVWTVAGASAGIVTLLGVLNRLEIDVLGVFQDMPQQDWNRANLLSTIGHSNWYAGYISVTIGIAMAAACCGKKAIRLLGMLGCFLFFASAVTANALTCVLSACGLCVLLVLVCLKERKTLLRALEIVMLLPISDLCIQLLVKSGKFGLVLGGETEKNVFFSSAWFWLLGIEALLYGILRIREAQHKKDLLADGRILRAVQRAGKAVLGIIAVCGIIFLMILGQGDILENPFMSKLLTASSGRLSLWCVTLQTFFKEALPQKLFGNGCDTYYYVMHEWGTDLSEWIASGALQNQIFTNAHNEFLTVLINQGIFGLLAYAGIFVTGQRTLGKNIWKKWEYFAVYFGTAGYLICALFTFQHVISTPYVFALLGMSVSLSKRT